MPHRKWENRARRSTPPVSRARSEILPSIPSKSASWFLKLTWAQDHLKGLRTELEWFKKEDPYTLSSKFDQQTGENVFIVVAVRRVPWRFTLQIGDCLHNIRSALDSLIWSLVEQDSGAPPPEWTEFPILRDVQKWPEARKRKIRGISPEAEAVIERHQPYHRGDQYAAHPLWVLHDLSRIDKHRHIHVTNVVLSGAHLRIRNTTVDVGENILAGPLEEGAEIARFPSTGPMWEGVNPEVDVSIDFPMDVAFGEGPAMNQPILPALEGVYRYVVRVITELGEFIRLGPTS